MNWYIIRQLLTPMLFITFALTGIIWLSQSLKYVDKLINGLPISTFLYLTVLLLPGILKFTLMLGLFFGTLFAFNKLYSESELVVMWAAGLSKWALTKPALYLALALMAVLYFISFVLTPHGIRTLDELRLEWRESLASVVLREGVFNSLSSGVTVYIREKSSSGELLGILVHDERDLEKPVTYMAEQGAFVKTEDGPRFVMKKGNLQEVQKDQAKLSILYFDDYTLDVSQFEKKRDKYWIDPKARYFHELMWPEESEKTARNMGEIIAELHQRFALPLYILALTYTAVAGVTSGEFTRRSRVKRLLTAAVSGILLIVLAVVLFRLAVSHSWITPLLYVVPLLAAGLSAHLASGGRIGNQPEISLQNPEMKET
ncbi:MAG: LPS export ABC transporter permease LptF [Sneathiellales bacterium]|nr:LPS export ABC transporter permease LptF [Sneathiellales bacterium]